MWECGNSKINLSSSHSSVSLQLFISVVVPQKMPEQSSFLCCLKLAAALGCFQVMEGSMSLNAAHVPGTEAGPASSPENKILLPGAVPVCRGKKKKKENLLRRSLRLEDALSSQI